MASFRKGLKELGYSDGKNIFIEERYAAGRPKRLPGLVAELLRLKLDIIVVHGSKTAYNVDRAARKAGRTYWFCVALLAMAEYENRLLFHKRKAVTILTNV